MIGLMDCNNFFVSCERLFRPDLAKKPVAVLSSNDGCIVARSQEVKDMGIPMGLPYFKVRDLCDPSGITFFSSNFTLYRDLSSRVMQTLRDIVEVCEVYSVDEAFFVLPNGVDEQDLSRVRGEVIQKTGIPVSIGAARTKTIAKAASVVAKRGAGVAILTGSSWRDHSQGMSCGAVWGVGRQTVKKLREAGIETVAELLDTDRSYVRKRFGVLGERVVMELEETPVTLVGESIGAPHQSITSTRSFATTTHELSILQSAVGYHTEHVGEKLREQGMTARHLRVIAAPGRYSDFALRNCVADRLLLEPTADSAVLIKEALLLLGTIYDSEIPYKKAGVVVGDLVPHAGRQETLFSEAEEGRNVSAVTDSLNERFGSGTVHFGVVQSTEKWRPSARLRSPEYTTGWRDICTVKAI